GVLERRMTASHGYVRHMISSLVKWYTFFVGVNYASMGWFATHPELQSSNTIFLIAGMFIMQNVLGIIACMRIRRYVIVAGNEFLATEQSLIGAALSSEARETLMPSPVYARAIQLMVLGLVFIVLVWVVFPFVRQNLASIPIDRILFK